MKYPDDFIDRVICGDCLEVMKEIPDKSVDAVITDPPYGFGRFETDDGNFIKLIQSAFVEVKRITRFGAWSFVFSGTGAVKDLLNAIDLDFQRLLWLYKPADCTYPYRGWLLTSEAIAVFTNGNPTPLLDRKPYRHDCYIHSRVGQEGVEGHPTVKPLDVIYDLCARVNGIVLDPFLGSGTTAVACKQLNRHFIGIEINPDYCKIARERLMGVPDSLFKETK